LGTLYYGRQSKYEIDNNLEEGVMKKKRKTIVLLLLLITALTFSACGGGGGGSSAPQAESDAYMYDSYDSEYTTFGVIENESLGYMAGGTARTAQTERQAVLEDRKIIRNATLEIIAEDAAGLYRDIVNYGVGVGGYEHSYSISNYEMFSVINASFKVPPDKLGSFLDFVGESGNVVYSSLSSDDITDSYYDAETRLNTKRRSLDQYYVLLSNASGVEEIAYIQRIIDGITEDIESLEGRLKVWSSQVNMATVDMYIRQENDPLQIRKEISWNTLSSDDMGYLIKQGFFTITNTITSAMQWLIVILVGYSPLWIIMAVGAYLWFRRKKRIDAKRTSELDKN